MNITKDDWFYGILGFYETEFKYTLEEIPDSIKNKMGSFDTISIFKLKEKIKHLKKLNTNKNLIVKYRKSHDNIDSFDTSALQFYAKQGTLFQVASNFNCLEIPHKNYNPFNGYFLTKQMIDYTQGPSASSGTAFGSVLRLINHKKNKIDLLIDTPIIQHNGKVKYSENNHIEEFDNDLIKIGLHSNVEANFLRSDNFKYKENGVKINQVFTSTCICNDSQPNKLSEIFLEKAYEGTYLSGIITKAPRIVLTLIGGSSFNNSIKLICDTIIKVHLKYSCYLPTDCVVELPIFEPNPSYILSNLKYNDVVKFELVE